MVTVDDVLRRVCAHHDVTMSELRSSRRHARIARARHEASWLLREVVVPRPSFPEIGRLLLKDHATVMHGCAKVEGLTQNEPGYLERLTEIVDAGRRPVVSPTMMAVVVARRAAFVCEVAA